MTFSGCIFSNKYSIGFVIPFDGKLNTHFIFLQNIYSNFLYATDFYMRPQSPFAMNIQQIPYLKCGAIYYMYMYSFFHILSYYLLPIHINFCAFSIFFSMYLICSILLQCSSKIYPNTLAYFSIFILPIFSPSKQFVILLCIIILDLSQLNLISYLLAHC